MNQHENNRKWAEVSAKENFGYQKAGFDWKDDGRKKI